MIWSAPPTAALWMSRSYLPNFKSFKALSPLRFAGALQMPVEVINRQRKRKISAARMREFAQRALTAIDVGDRDAAVVFVSDAAMRRLNRDFRGRDRATDVLSFPAQPEPFEGRSQLGEVVVSIERAAAQAKANRLSLTNEIQQLILHGLLHLCGYDHETDTGEMNRFELRLRKKLRI